MYTTATLAGKLDWPFLWTLPVAALGRRACSASRLGAVVFRVRALRGELFALLTLAVTFVLSHDRAQHADRRRPGRLPGAVPVPKLAPTASGVLYLLMLAAAALTLLDRLRDVPLPVRHGPVRHPRRRGRRRGDGRADLSLQAGRFRPSRARSPASPAASTRCSSPTSPSAETFTITVPLTVVLMSVLGGTRHWAGPAVGAIAITALLYAFTAATHAVAGKALSRSRS